MTMITMRRSISISFRSKNARNKHRIL